MRSTEWDEICHLVWACNRHPEVNDICRRAAARMEEIGRPELVRFFADLVNRYAGWTFDLPASQRNHHACRFGLLIHSAEAVERAVDVGLATSPGLPPEWVQATVAFALFHDCGRLLDLHVTDASGRVWDPFQQSLRHFSRDGQVTYSWKPGRGLDRHEYRSLDLFPLFLPETAVDTLLPLLKDAWFAYVNRNWIGPDFVGAYAWCAAGIVAWADQRSAQDDYFARKLAARTSPTAKVSAPVSYYSPKPSARANSRETR